MSFAFNIYYSRPSIFISMNRWIPRKANVMFHIYYLYRRPQKYSSSLFQFSAFELTGSEQHRICQTRSSQLVISRFTFDWLIFVLLSCKLCLLVLVDIVVVVVGGSVCRFQLFFFCHPFPLTHRPIALHRRQWVVQKCPQEVNKQLHAAEPNCHGHNNFFIVSDLFSVCIRIVRKYRQQQKQQQITHEHVWSGKRFVVRYNYIN